MISRKLLCAATLACLAPFGASADTYLTPASNGGSGVLPSGHTRLHFEMSHGDWVDQVKLPTAPRDGDQVTLSNTYSSMASLLLTAGSALEDAAFAPIKAGHALDLRWNGQRQVWDVWEGASSRGFGSQEGAAMRIPAGDHMLTQLEMWDGAVASRVYLAMSGQRGALTVISNYGGKSTIVDGSDLVDGKDSVCSAESRCTYVLNGDGKWSPRRGQAVTQATQPLLAEPATRLTDVIIGEAVTDISTPFRMYLPRAASDGDVYRFFNPNPRGIYFVSNTSLFANGYTSFQFNAATQKWTFPR